MAAAGATGAKRADQITLSMVTLANQQTAWQVLIPNFERVYPNIKVNISYAANNTQLYQLETTQLAAGNAPDILAATPGQGTPNAVSTLAKAGYLAPMIGKPWAKRLVAPVTSRDKVGKALYAYTPGIGLYGVFTNDTLFKKLGLKVPQTSSRSSTSVRRRRRRVSPRGSSADPTSRDRSSSRWTSPSRMSTRRTRTGRPSARRARSPSPARRAGASHSSSSST